MPALPPHHVARPRLARALAASPVGLVEAGGGYGKSVLATELRELLGTASAEAVLEREVDEAGELLGALRRGLRRAGLSDVAAALAEPSPAAVAEALALTDDPLLLVVDEVQRAGGAAAEFLAALARQLPAHHRLLLVGRRLDPRLAALHGAIGAARLDAAALAFDADELTGLLAGLLGYAPSPEQVAHVRRVAHGWPAACVVAGLRLAHGGVPGTAGPPPAPADHPRPDGPPPAPADHPRPDGPPPAPADHPRPDGPPPAPADHPRPDGPPPAPADHPRPGDPLPAHSAPPRPGGLGEMIDGLLAGVGAADQARIARLGQLPLLSREVAAACAGPGALELLLDAGLPVRAGRFGWLELPEPVRDELARREPLGAAAARAAASAYADAGELSTALALLAGDGPGVAALLAARRWQELGALELAELRAILGTLPAEALAEHPFGLVQIARIAERTIALDERGALLERALTLLRTGPSRREAEADLAAARAVTDPGEAAESAARAVLAAAAPAETVARARALTALARVEAWRGDPASLLAAESKLAEAAALFRHAGESEWEAWTLTGLGYRVAFARGDLERAIDRMTAALALLPEPDGERAAVATFLAEALAYVGRLDDAESALREAAGIGRRLGDHRVRAYAAWTWTTLASLRGDTAGTIQLIRTVEHHPGDWFEHPTGAEFLADAALALARVGEQGLAREYAARAQRRADAAGHPEIGWIATGAVAARWGDPARAARALEDFAASPQQAPRDEWRTLLLRARAAQRAGDPAAAALAARAYEAADQLGRPDLPALHEPDLAATLAGLAAAAGSRAAAAEGTREPALQVTLLGGFGVSADGRPVVPPPGRGATLVKLLALDGGPVGAEQAVEILWPEADGPTGRARLRNLLNRVRASCGELVAREGEALVLAATAVVDARGFEEAAAAVRAAPEGERAGLARAALARYAGELLPADRYETWASAARERLRRRYLGLLDLLAEDAVERGELDEAIRLLDLAQVAEPLDEGRYVRAAELLLFQGRRGSARALVERALEVRAGLGLDETPRLARLREATGG